MRGGGSWYLSWHKINRKPVPQASTDVKVYNSSNGFLLLLFRPSSPTCIKWKTWLGNQFVEPEFHPYMYNAPNDKWLFHRQQQRQSSVCRQHLPTTPFARLPLSLSIYIVIPLSISLYFSLFLFSRPVYSLSLSAIFLNLYTLSYIYNFPHHTPIRTTHTAPSYTHANARF